MGYASGFHERLRSRWKEIEGRHRRCDAKDHHHPDAMIRDNVAWDADPREGSRTAATTQLL
jgi:hypothetical protein